MNRYGILGRYLPGWPCSRPDTARPVSSHRRCTRPESGQTAQLRHPTLPKSLLAGAIIARLPRPEVLYMTGYIDIAGGRSGDHSRAGCRRRPCLCCAPPAACGRSPANGPLVRNHLIMSITAQQRPVRARRDPLLPRKSATRCWIPVSAHRGRHQRHQPETMEFGVPRLRQPCMDRRALRRAWPTAGRSDRARQAAALSLLCSDGACNTAVQAIWSHLGDDYFLRHSAGDVPGIPPAS